MPRGKPYPPEFRREAVQLARSSDRSIRAVADDAQGVRAVADGERVLKKSRSLLRGGDGSIRPAEAFRLIDALKATYPVTMMSRLLGVNPRSFHAWRRRDPSDAAVRRMRLTALIVEIHRESWRTYGSPRIHAELAAQGEQVSLQLVEKLMRAAGIQGVKKRKKGRPPRRDQRPLPSPDLVDRKFTANAPNELWVADMTYRMTGEGWAYVATITDVHSRFCVGWLPNTARRRRPDRSAGAARAAPRCARSRGAVRRARTLRPPRLHRNPPAKPARATRPARAGRAPRRSQLPRPASVRRGCTAPRRSNPAWRARRRPHARASTHR